MKQRSFFVVLSSAILTFLLLACALVGQARLVVKPEAVSRVDELLTQMTRDGTFSGSVLIAQDGVVFLSKGYGLADRAKGVPNAPQTRFHLGCITKQFTAIGILILESQGKLSVQDPICNFITGCPTEWQDITIHHLLTNTSGLSTMQSGWLDTAIQSTTTGLAAPAEQAKYLGLTIRWFLDAQPGEQFSYSNFSYYLLAHIIEQVSGQSYADFVEQNIFTPLNMHNTGYQVSTSRVAEIYPDGDTMAGRKYGSPAVSDGAGQMYSSTEDLLLWDQVLNTGQILPQDELDRMFTRFVYDTGDIPGFGYGYGWFVTKILGRPILLSTGGGRAFVTVYFRLPEDGLTLIVLTNQGDVNYQSRMTSDVLAIASALFLRDLIFALSAITFLILLAVLLAARLYRNKAGETQSQG